MIPRAIAGIVFVASTLAVLAARGNAQDVAEPERYRTEDYRAPTPTTLRGARIITTAEAEALWKAGTAAFVDVMPHAPRPPDLPMGTIWREKGRLNIPGSIWLPDTGYGELSPAMEQYLRAGLEQVTGGDRAKPAGHLLRPGLLDVVECRQAGHFVGICRRRLVSRRHRRLARRRTPAQRGAPSAASQRVRLIRAIAGSRARARTGAARSEREPRTHSRWSSGVLRKYACPIRRG